MKHRRKGSFLIKLNKVLQNIEYELANRVMNVGRAGSKHSKYRKFQYFSKSLSLYIKIIFIDVITVFSNKHLRNVFRTKRFLNNVIILV